MRLFLLPRDFDSSSALSGDYVYEIKGSDFNYLIHALRLKVGQSVMARDLDGGLWKLDIVEVSKHSCKVVVSTSEQAVEYTDSLPEQKSLKPIVLYQCLPKGRKMDDIIKKATEAGVRDIVLVRSRNCVTDLSGKEEGRIQRYDAVVKEAIQQSGSVVPTKVEGVIDIKDVPGDFARRASMYSEGRALGLVLHQCTVRENQSSLVEVAEGFDGTVGLVVGSEGGLTDQECSLLMEDGFKAILLKTNILRCETASIYAIGAVQTLIETGC